MKIEFLPISQMTGLPEEDVKWLAMAGEKLISPLEWVEKALAGECAIHRISGEAEGIIVLARVGDELHVEGFAGKGLIKHFPEFYRQVRLIGASCGAIKLVGWVRRKGIEKLYQKHTGARPGPTLWSEEI